ncbi:hypothetical protein TYRP_020372 [Tyrophagus putrescentiae]|nr:hypothetical protein TYRP_020372 [Tyrophagus putrescentiae]
MEQFVAALFYVGRGTSADRPYVHERKDGERCLTNESLAIYLKKFNSSKRRFTFSEITGFTEFTELFEHSSLVRSSEISDPKELLKQNTVKVVRSSNDEQATEQW